MARRRKRISPKSNFFKKIKKRSVAKKKMVKKILWVLIGGLLSYRFFSGPYGFIQIHSLWEEKKMLKKESRRLDAEIVDLEIEKRRLSFDEFYLEKQARERLGMIKQGEKIYRIIHRNISHLPDEDEGPTSPIPSDSVSP